MYPKLSNWKLVGQYVTNTSFSQTLSNSYLLFLPPWITLNSVAPPNYLSPQLKNGIETPNMNSSIWVLHQSNTPDRLSSHIRLLSCDKSAIFNLLGYYVNKLRWAQNKWTSSWKIFNCVPQPSTLQTQQQILNIN